MIESIIPCEPSVSIIILNWNGWQDTIECLESLFQINYPNYDVILVDNYSTDESIESIRRYARGEIPVNSTFFSYIENNKPLHFVEFDEERLEENRIENQKIPLDTKNQLILIKNSKNHGFAEGNNIGMRFALDYLKPDYIFLLNNDTIVTKDFLNYLVNTAEKDEKIGICSPKLLKMHNPEIIDSTGHVFRWGRIVDRGVNERDTGQYDSKIDIIGAIAAASLYKVDMLNEIGLFDKEYFTMYEDADLSWRAYNAGWKGRYVPSAIVYHKRGGTIKKNPELSKKMKILGFTNMIKTVEKYGTLIQKIEFYSSFILTGILSGIGKVLGRNYIGYEPYFTALKEYFSKKPSNLKEGL